MLAVAREAMTWLLARTAMIMSTANRESMHYAQPIYNALEPVHQTKCIAVPISIARGKLHKLLQHFNRKLGIR